MFKKLSKILFIMLAIILFAGIFNPVSESNKIYAYDKNSEYSFEITNYYVNINVNENNVYNITERISVKFNILQHGIIRHIPIVNNVERSDGSYEKNVAIISNIKVNNKYSTSVDNNYKVLKIGDEDTYANATETYVISYDYNLGKDKNKNFDELYFNIIGTEWTAPIHNASFTINMPKDFDESKLAIYTGRFGSVDDDIEYTVTNNVISGHTTSALNAYSGITIRMQLEENYFSKAVSTIDIANAISLSLVILITLFAMFILLKFNYKAKNGVISTVEFYPPDKLNSAIIGMVYRGKCKTKFVLSLIVQLASLGYIEIHDATKINSNKKETILVKVKNYNGKDKSLKNIFDAMFTTTYSGDYYLETYDIPTVKNLTKFKKADCITLSGLKSSFGKAVETETKNLNEKQSVSQYFKTNKLNIVLIIIAIASLLIANLSCVILIDATMFFILLFPLIAALVALLGKNMPLVFKIMWCALFGCLPWFTLIKMNAPIFEAPFVIANILSFIILLSTVLFSDTLVIRDENGKKLFGKILGFRNFIKTAEKQKLEMLVLENPKYFYNILPYAYVLNVSSKWIEKFEDIIIEENCIYFSGRISVYRFNQLNRNITTVNNRHYLTNHAAHSSGSSGGFSSGGGGGFSGGGSGGGGGSSW